MAAIIRFGMWRAWIALRHSTLTPRTRLEHPRWVGTNPSYVDCEVGVELSSEPVDAVRPSRKRSVAGSLIGCTGDCQFNGENIGLCRNLDCMLSRKNINIKMRLKAAVLA